MTFIDERQTHLTMTPEQDWTSLRIGDICTKIGSGATPRGGKEVYLSDGPFTLIRSQNVYNNRFSHDGLVYINKQHAADLNNVEVKTDDVLLNITGDSVARSCQVPKEILPARVNQHVAIIRPDPSKLSSHFLRYVLVSPEIQSMLLSWAGSGGTRNALTKDMIESIIIHAPAHIGEQQAIADILSTLDDKIELNRLMNETLEEMARALFKSWFVDFDPVRAKMEGRDTGLPNDITHLFPDRMVDSELGEIPEGWEACTIREIASLNPESWKSGHHPASVVYVDLTNTKWGCIENIETFVWEKAPSRARRVLRINDTIIATVRPGNGSFALIDEEGLTGSTGFAVLRPHKTYDREFVWCSATSPDNIARLAHLADGGAYPAIRPSVVLETPVVLADQATRKVFSSTTGKLIDRMEANKREARTLAALRDAQLPKLISGELQV